MIVTFLAFNLNCDVFNILTPSLFSPKIEGNGNQLNMFSTKKLWKVTILWLRMENEFCFDKTRLHLIANLHYFVLFLFQIHLLIWLPNSCIVVSRVGFVSSLGTPHRETHGWRLYLRQEVLSTTVFLDSNYVLFHCLIKWSQGGATEVDSPIRMYRYVFRTISWNIEIHSGLLFS